MKKEDLSEQDYKQFEAKLFSPSTPTPELENICMTLAHIPTQRAQQLLAMFTKSGRAHEVTWLGVAAEEGQFHYLSPQNEQEERDYLALKVMQELQDQLMELEIQFNDAKVAFDKMEIQHEAIRQLVKKGELEPEAEAGLHDARGNFESNVEALRRQIQLKEKIYDQIGESIKTERYKEADPMVMRDIHWG